ncbi:acyl-CoA dehydrogenase N-terminal domain-containing protein [Mesorhizobium sp. LHD-90]|nr:acyl-CoA dehydrogenase N-terminal domain-containing protein [Mesorhizobium sp. LHD-90]MDQ6433185.1 acyl-CoA dehydrogenase N-terminal domain-containing protein [Mesorhizobium sp. LHD-90]
MASYSPPIDDIAFLLAEVFDFDRLMRSLPGCQDVDAKLAVSILEEGGRFCTGVLEPLNRSGDEEGCRLTDGQVFTPKGMPEAYRAFVDAGWSALFGRPGVWRAGPASRHPDPVR